MSELDDDRQSDFVRPLRLASDTELTWDVLDEVGLRSFVAVAETCYRIRSLGQDLPTVELVTRQDLQALREALGLIGSIGEGIWAAIGCEVEIEAHRRGRSEETWESLEPSRRFFAIAEAQELLGIGHRIINTAARLLFVSPDHRPLLETALPKWAAAYEPFDLERRDGWLSLSKNEARFVEHVARTSPHRSIRTCGEVVHRLQKSEPWRSLDELRGEVFHRARPESSAVLGVDATSGFLTPMFDDDGKQTGYAHKSDPNRYQGGDGREARELATSRAALDTIAECSLSLANAATAAIEPLTAGRYWYSEESDTFHHRFGSRWDPDKCTCCGPPT